MIKVREKVAYGLGDTASNIIFQTVMLFLAFFYTDIAGISAAAVGTMFLVVRLIDAVTDPLMGIMADRTDSRHGQFRPYLLWLAIPFALCSILAFTTIDGTATQKLIYAYATYTLLMLAYTAINIPYSALGAVLSADPSERVSIQSYRFVFAMLGGLLVTSLTLPLVDWFGQGDQAHGYLMTMGLMSLFGLVLFLLCFKGTKERVQSPTDTRLKVKSALSLLWANHAWRRLAIAAVLLLVGMTIKNTLAIYYVKYYLLREDLITEFITLGMVGNIMGCACAQWVSARFEKVNAYIVLQIIAALLCASAYWAAADQLVFAFSLYFLWGFFIQMGTPMLWAKIADAADYGQWQSGVKTTGLVYSSIIFFIKLGLAIGGAIAGWWLAFYNYVPEVMQSAETQSGILIAFTLLPALASLLVVFVMRGYILKYNKVLEISRELQA